MNSCNGWLQNVIERRKKNAKNGTLKLSTCIQIHYFNNQLCFSLQFQIINCSIVFVVVLDEVKM